MAIKYTGSYITCDTEADVLAMPGRPGDVAYAVDTDMRYKSNGASWFPTDALRVIRGTGIIDLKTAASTKILTIPPTTFRFVVVAAHLEITDLVGTVVLQSTLSIGTVAAAYNNIVAAQLLNGILQSVGLTSTNSLTLTSAVAALAGSTDVYAKVTIPATGPSSYKARIDLMGYYEV